METFVWPWSWSMCHWYSVACFSNPDSTELICVLFCKSDLDSNLDQTDKKLQEEKGANFGFHGTQNLIMNGPSSINSWLANRMLSLQYIFEGPWDMSLLIYATDEKKLSDPEVFKVIVSAVLVLKWMVACLGDLGGHLWSFISLMKETFKE